MPAFASTGVTAVSAKKSCFVIMPIRKPGTDEFEYFRALRDTVIGPALGSEYEVTRADDVAKTGAITRDVIERLATADLVVADLTDLNPNVFYELGIRHALRAQGTIMIVDTTRTSIPFDLAPYRVIDYTPDLRGFQKLRDMLVKFSAAIAGDIPDTAKDNPVHDFLPSLPTDIYAHAAGTTEGALREEIARLKATLRRYADAHGPGLDALTTEGDAVDVITMALAQAQRGELPGDLMRKARAYARDKDAVHFLEVLRQLLDAPRGEVSVQDIIGLAGDAASLGLNSVANALQERALQLRPNDAKLRRMQLSGLAHSEDPHQRERARRGLLDELGITIGADGEVRLPDHFDRENLITLALMLDAYHRDGLENDALAITTALLARFPENTVVLRNHARALASVGRRGEAFDYFRAAIGAPDADDTSAVWYGNELSREGDYIGAAQAYLRACQLDPDDASNFANVADALADALREQAIGQRVSRPLPPEVTVDVVVAFLSCTFSCPTVDADAVRFANTAAQTAELPTDVIASLAQISRATQPADEDQLVHFFGRMERLDLAKGLTELLAETREPGSG